MSEALSEVLSEALCPAARHDMSKCEDCLTKTAFFAAGNTATTAAAIERQWCRACARSHPGAIDLTNKCESCSIKTANFGSLAENKRRWCGSCATDTGAINLARKNDPGRTGAFGARPDWQLSNAATAPTRVQHSAPKPALSLATKPPPVESVDVAAHHRGPAGKMDMARKKCEGCDTKRASFALPNEGRRRRWCAGCATAYAGTV